MTSDPHTVTGRRIMPAPTVTGRLILPAPTVTGRRIMPAPTVTGRLIMLAMSAGLLAGCALHFVWDPAPADSQLSIVNRQSTIATPADSAADGDGFREAVRRLSTPELEKRKQNRREYQQRHYAEVLYELTLMDAPGALLASLRSQAQLELQLPNNTLYVTIPIVQPPPSQTSLPGFSALPSAHMQIPLLEDRRFPADPWSLK